MRNGAKTVIQILKIFNVLSFTAAGGYLAFAFARDISQGLQNTVSYTDYILSLLQCALGVYAVFIPTVLKRKLDFSFPDTMYLLYLIFLYCAIFLGEVQSYYINVPLWDDILHGFSGVMAAFFAFMLATVMTRRNNVTKKLSPIFLTIFAFVFSLSVGTLWEIYEFSLDTALDLNMQKYRLNDGTQLIGKSALFDTMKDIITDSLGAFVAALFGYFSLKRKKGWIYCYTENRNRYSENTGNDNEQDTVKAFGKKENTNKV
ncbi:MAG: hypothetical protein IKB34_00925 [Clostridia bacterium]|nr:hypothetical protein [Clostridia bacterium]